MSTNGESLITRGPNRAISMPGDGPMPSRQHCSGERLVGAVACKESGGFLGILSWLDAVYGRYIAVGPGQWRSTGLSTRSPISIDLLTKIEPPYRRSSCR